MAEASIQVDGLDELRRLVRKAPPEIRKQLRATNKAAAEIVAAEARVLVPVRSGRLRSSIKATAGQKEASVKAGTAARVPYAGPVHFGWPGRPNKARRWRGGPIRAQPFLYAARDRRINEVRGAYEQALDRFAQTLTTD